MMILGGVALMLCGFALFILCLAIAASNDALWPLPWLAGGVPIALGVIMVLMGFWG